MALVVVLGGVFMLWSINVPAAAAVAAFLQFLAFTACIYLAAKARSVALLLPATLLCLMTGLAVETFFDVLSPVSVAAFKDRDVLLVALNAIISLLAGYFLWAYLKAQRRQAELAESRFDRLMEMLPEAAFLADTTGVVRHCNPALANLVGHDPTGENCNQVIFGTAPGCPDCLGEKVIQGETRTWECIQPQTGRVLNIVQCDVFDDKGGILRLSLIRDLTELRTQESALIESADRFRAIFEGSMDAALVETMDGRILAANSAAADLLGYTHRELLQLQALDLVPDALRAELPTPEDLSALPEGARFESECLTKDGSILPVELAAKAISLAGTPLLLVDLRDLRPLRMAQSQLEAAYIHQRKLVDAIGKIGIGVFLVREYAGKRATIVYCNPTAASMVGATPEELEFHRSLAELVAPEDLPLLDREYARADRGERLRTQIRLHLLNKKGERRLVEAHVVAFPAEEDEGPGWLGFVMDVTESTKREATRLQRCRFELVGKLASGIAHDFRNYLGAIKGQAEMASQTEPLPEQARASLARLLDTTCSANLLAERLMAFAHHGEATQTSPVDLNEALETVLAISTAITAHLEIEVNLASDLPRVNAWPGSLEQIILNLLLNAASATQPGGSLTITTSRKNNEIEIVFTDTGCGMDSDTLERLFELFFTTRANNGGTGLGLYIVKSTLDELGGRIEVASIPGAGSTFHLYLPVADQA